MKALGMRPSKLKRDAGIPNICPFKDKLIEQLELKENADKEALLKLKGAKGKKEETDIMDYMEEV